MGLLNIIFPSGLPPSSSALTLYISICVGHPWSPALPDDIALGCHNQCPNEDVRPHATHEILPVCSVISDPSLFSPSMSEMT